MSVYELAGRKALVTGGAQGLGAGMAEALARAGASVVIGDMQEEQGKATAESLRECGARPSTWSLTSARMRAGSTRSSRRSVRSAAWTSW